MTIAEKLDRLFPVACYICAGAVSRINNPRLVCPNCKASQNDPEAKTASQNKQEAE